MDDNENVNSRFNLIFNGAFHPIKIIFNLVSVVPGSFVEMSNGVCAIT